MRSTLASPHKKVAIFFNSRVFAHKYSTIQVSKDTMIEAPQFCQIHLIANLRYKVPVLAVYYNKSTICASFTTFLSLHMENI